MKPACLHCTERPQVADSVLCDVCAVYPRCEVCSIIFGERTAVASENPNRCDLCLNFEDKIKFACSRCNKKLPLFYSPNTNTPHIVVRGNWCGECNGICARESKVVKEKDDSQFVGYLALLHSQLLMGKITQGQFDEAVLRNPQSNNGKIRTEQPDVYMDELSEDYILSEIDEIMSELTND